MLLHPEQLGFVLDCQNYEIRMVWQIAETEFGSGIDSGVTALNRLLRGRQVFPDKDVDIVFEGLCVRFHDFVSCVKMTVKLMSESYLCNCRAKCFWVSQIVIRMSMAGMRRNQNAN